jgi:signal transduction histidine kinase
LTFKADCLQLLEKIHVARSDYKKAYESLLEWRKIDTALHSLQLSIKIAELQEKYHAQRQLEENKHLELELIANKARNKLSITIASLLFLTVLVSIAIILLIKSNNSKLTEKNKQIRAQNNQLIELSEEQNQLVSFVAHDLNTPFATIDIWTRIALEGDYGLDPTLKKTLQKISTASNAGQNMIRRMLDLEKELNFTGFQARFERTDISQLLDVTLDSLSPLAVQKKIEVDFNNPTSPLFLDTDPELFQRLVENLVTNAIKFSNRNSKIIFGVEDSPTQFTLCVQDFGVGIKKDELPFLFLKYKRISSTPTEGEPSVGLGLVLSKKIVDLLQGSIKCESELEKGTTFIISLPKHR